MTDVQTPAPRSVDELTATFVEQFEAEPDGVWFAPGRVNIIGEHTDYNDGFVLPIALAEGTWVAARRRDDDTVRLHTDSSDVSDQSVTLRLGDLHEGQSVGWASYAAGVGWAAAQRGLEVPGLDIAVASNVPTGAGLSSSAALSCGTARAWVDLAGWSLSDTQVADLGRDAENHIAGAPTGLMDQLASVCGQSGHAMQIDTRSVKITQIPFDLPSHDLALLVIDSRAPHALVSGEYAERRQSCQEAAAALGVRALRDASVDDLDGLPDLLQRRARHVITDSERVEQVADLLTNGSDPRTIGPLLTQSHISMRDDFEITVPVTDLIAETACAAGAYGARQTGGGFGGCVIALVDADAVETVAAACADAAVSAGFTRPVAFVAVPSDGARRIS
ncbi:galactokinase [Branchiibius sp. NY16-3462-2]|uniref:galactokinase n=1 Tax=Branchiibius sp. NY16-3462-2 TaxID=1807500 RepID=UPI000794F94C|nr:galactokinase [Branchiibius sp. NY16-3462-2]KYH45070.1 galactokinase [Branchiibius sp. NY16-3462-2]